LWPDERSLRATAPPWEPDAPVTKKVSGEDISF
jgi:hypothetical protein